MDRRKLIQALAGTTALGACRPDSASEASPHPDPDEPRRTGDETGSPAGRTVAGRPVVRRVLPISSPFPTLDPFLFCAHHDDAYPEGNEALGPKVSLQGRTLGSDFSGRDGFSMYHGQIVPGFPEHPHRGFETITVVRKGLVDHSDSLGATARYGDGDVQWLTAGAGIVHAEMFPLLHKNETNPLNLFQIWLNLPRRDKFVRPYFSMFWANQVPRLQTSDARGRTTFVTLIAGQWGTRRPPSPPPDSWASRPESDLFIAVLEMEPGAECTLPPGHPDSKRMIYLPSGAGVTLGTTEVSGKHAAEVTPDQSLILRAGPAPTEVLVLHGRPIGEPVVKHGPFVMNSREEIREAYVDYQATGFGGWPWKDRAPIHGTKPERFARHADGRFEKAT